MQSLWQLVSLSIVFLGIQACERPTESPQLEAIASALASSQHTITTSTLQLSVELKEDASQVLVRCRATNASPEAVTIPSGAVPCARGAGLTIAAITSRGESIGSRAPLGGGIIEEANYTIPPGGWIERDVDLEGTYDTRTLPREHDVILLWTYRGLGPIRSGVALLPRRPQ